MCGKNALALLSQLFWTGSPPRVREKLHQFVLVWLVHGITPACAGKTSISVTRFLSIQDHPRVCGKNLSLVTWTPFNSGSPPRVREKLELLEISQDEIGITPACAGKTSNRLMVYQLWRDHPRVCGKNTKRSQ